MQKTRFILVAAAALMATQAFAQVPDLDIEKTCRAAQPLLGNEETGNTSNLGNTGGASTYQTCMQSETAAKKSSEELWSKVDPADRENCVGLSKMVYPSYVELMSCLQMYNPATSGVTPAEENVPQTTRPARRP